MSKHLIFLAALFCVLLVHSGASGQSSDTFAPLSDGVAPGNLVAMWGDFDPRAEPLRIETLTEWEEENVILRVVRFHVGVFKGKSASIAAVYGYPKGQANLPGLVQIHGGGQYADVKACLANARRGYATVSIAWAGRISSSKYRVNPAGVQLFWDGKTGDPDYRLTTDWGAVDGYHAPSRNPGNVFPSAKPHAWTLDAVESPRNSGWFLAATAARRALTFLERQPEVDRTRLGVYGHSMGGKLTVLTAVDSRVKAAAPSCGGVSDRYNDSELFRTTLGDDASLKEVRCPIIFLSPANDFHGRIVDLPDTIDEIQSAQWRVTCSPQHSHQDTPPYEVATLLWFDQHLKKAFEFPKTPDAKLNLPDGGVPSIEVSVDHSMQVLSVDVYYTQHGKQGETPFDRDLTTNRFWHHVKPALNNESAKDGTLTAELPISSVDEPLMAYANVSYELDESITGAGYYYGTYVAESFNLSSLVSTAWRNELASSGVIATLNPTTIIESFDGDWKKEWFTYRPADWARTTHKLRDAKYAAPAGAKLSIEALSEQRNRLVVLIDDFAAEIPLTGGTDFQSFALSPVDFRNYDGESLSGWESAKRLKLSSIERLKPGRRQGGKPKVVGQLWNGEPPTFRSLKWTTDSD